MIAQHEGYQSAEHTLAGSGLIRVALTPSCGVFGRVIDGRGSPVGRCAVTLHERGESPGSSFEGARWTTTAGDGSYAFSGLPPAEYELVAENESLLAAESIDLRRSGSAVELNLFAAEKGHCSLNGLVLSRGVGVSSASIRLHRSVGGRQVYVASANADYSGRYRFDRLAPGNYLARIRYELDGVEFAHSAPIIVQGPGDVLNIRVPDTYCEVLVTEGATGVPLPGVVVTARGSEFGTLSGRTGEDGLIRLGGVRGQAVQFMAPARSSMPGEPSGRFAQSTIVRDISGESRPRFDLQLERGYMVRGIVSNETGTPRGMAVLEFRSPSSKDTPVVAIANVDGEFALRLATGRYTITVVGATVTAGSTTLSVPAPEAAAITVRDS